jgi:glycosyltransferase involved in cell wall biosynthesis
MQFSVVTPVLNGMPWLPECVRSVASQRETVEVEHILLDAGSTDGSREWLVDHRSEYGYDLVLEPDRGQTDGLIKGFSRARGEVFSWLNADDLLEPNALARVQQAFADCQGTTLVSGCCINVDAAGDFTHLMVPPRANTYDGLRLEVGNPAQPATFFRADAYRSVGGLNREYNLAMDVDLWLRLAREGHVTYLRQDVLARFRVHLAAKSVVDLTGAIREDFSIRRRHGLPIRSPAGFWFLRRGYLGPWLKPAVDGLKRLVKSIAFR